MVNASNLDFLFSLNGKDITKSAIFKLFGKHLNSITNEVEEPMFYTWEEIDVKAGQIGNLHEDVHTTVGRYLLYNDPQFLEGRQPLSNTYAAASLSSFLMSSSCSSVIVDGQVVAILEPFLSESAFFDATKFSSRV